MLESTCALYFPGRRASHVDINLPALKRRLQILLEMGGINSWEGRRGELEIAKYGGRLGGEEINRAFVFYFYLHMKFIVSVDLFLQSSLLGLTASALNKTQAPELLIYELSISS